MEMPGDEGCTGRGLQMPRSEMLGDPERHAQRVPLYLVTVKQTDLLLHSPSPANHLPNGSLATTEVTCVLSLQQPSSLWLWRLGEEAAARQPLFLITWPSTLVNKCPEPKRALPRESVWLVKCGHFLRVFDKPTDKST